MPVTLVNPYCTLAQLKDELKMKSSDTSVDDHLNFSINQAARWLDRYTGRRFHFVDALVTPLVLDEFDRVYDEVVFLIHRPIRALVSVVLGTTELLNGTDYRVRSSLSDPAPGAQDQLLRLGGSWNLKRQTGNLLTIKGTFGYLQPATYTFAIAGAVGSIISGLSLTGWNLQNLSKAYWRATLSAGNYFVQIATSASFDTLLASGSIATPSGTVTLTQQNSSGLSGSVTLAYTADDSDAANIVTPATVAITTTGVPTDLPAEIAKAAILVAAAFSGQNRKEVAGLDGQQTQLLDTAIPRTVFEMLGKRSPLLV